MRLHATLALLILAGCDSSGAAGDGGTDAACSIDVALGTGDRDTFAPLADGDPVEVVLGFQGFRMLVLAMEVRGVDTGSADISAHLEIGASGLETDQVDRQMTLVSTGAETGVVEEYLIFFNDAPASEIVGHRAVIQHIVRAGGCTGTSEVEVELRDDDACVDYDVEIDASVPDGGLVDGGVACE